MRLVWICAPLVALGVAIVGAKLFRRPLPRPALHALVSVVLLGYLLTTAALGTFWVARMELPVFSAHYLTGYCTLVVLTLHVALGARPLAVQLRRVSPRALLSPDGGRFRTAARASAGLLLGALLLAPLAAFVAGRASYEPAHVVRAPAGSARAATGHEIWIMEKGDKMPSVDWLHRATSHPGPDDWPRFTVERPDETKSYPGPAQVLPPAATRAGKSLESLARRARSPEGSMVRDREPSLDELATWLAWSAGVTSRKAARAGLLLRAAASAGALYPVDVYVADAMSVRYYDPPRHALLPTSGSPEAIRRSLWAGSAVRNAPLTFVLGATFDRTVHKYGARSYRYLALDAGHVAGNLVLAARAAGFECVLEPWFDDELLLAAVAGDPKQEGALLVLGCALDAQPSDRIPNHVTVELPENTRALETTRLSHRLTSWRLLPDSIQAAPPSLAATPPGALVLPEPALKDETSGARGGDLYELIAKRRSQREFSDRTVTRAALSGVLQLAWEGARLANAALVELYVAANRKADLAPGIYRYFPEAHALGLVRSGDFAGALRSAGLDQDMLLDAAFVLVFGLAHQGHITGARDFRAGALAAGVAGAFGYLAAGAHELGSCGIGAFEDERVAALLGVPTARPVYLMAMGAR